MTLADDLYVIVNDLIGGWSIGNVNKPLSEYDLRPESGTGEVVIADFVRAEDAHEFVAMRDRIGQLEAELLLARAGCRCARPLLGSRPGVGPRCRLCNVVAEDGAS